MGSLNVHGTRPRSPIVLAHGLFGFERIGFGPLTLARYFRALPDELRAAGSRVLVTKVHPTAAVRRRGQILGARIEAAFGREPVHVVGHSMGGLDARSLLAEPGWGEGRVLSLTTVGTPHLGSFLADIAEVNMSGIYHILRHAGWDHGGFLDITTDRARRWHEETPAPSGVPCYSVAGDPASGEICGPMRRWHALLERVEGANDGVVSVASALAFGEPLPSWPVDHLRQLGWLCGPARGDRLRRIYGLWAGLVERLAEAERVMA